MRQFTAVGAIGILMAIAGNAVADIASLSCDGQLHNRTKDGPVPLKFSLQVDTSSNILLTYTLWGSDKMGTPEKPIIGEMDGQLLSFMYVDKAWSVAHIIGVDRVSGDFRHIEADMVDGKPSEKPRLVVKGVCQRATPLL